MKRFILSSLFMALSFLYVTGQVVSISGTITDSGNGQVVANHPVFIMTDSLSGGFFYYNQVLTNNQGVYSDVVAVPGNIQIMFYIGTIDCNGSYIMQTVVSTNTPVVADFSICTGGTSNCQADFVPIPDSSNPTGSLTYQFWDLSIGNPVSWSWDFGDGTNSTLQYPVHTYAQPGIYNVCLTIATASGCTSTFCLTVTVNVLPSCYAYFNFTPDPSGYGFQFTDASIGNPTNWQWSFGDGTGSNLQNPAHQYNAPGSYYVCLTIWGNNCQSSYCDYVFVSGGQNCNAQFMAYPDSGSVHTWFFSDFSSGNVISWDWTFGDGGTSTLQYPVHTYAQNGTYLVCLTILTSDTCTSTYCDSVFVGTNPSCFTYFTYTNNGLTATFDAWSFGGTAPYAYTWDLGDGTTATGSAPVHTYAAPGNYTVTLTSIDAAGCSSTYTSIVWVGNTVTGTIWGQIFAGGAVLDWGWVYLYMDGGPANPMFMIDSTMVDSSGYYNFIILNPLPGTYYVKAVPSANSVFYSTYLPTYYISTPFWANATPANLFQASNIILVPLNGPVQGNGNINGQVTSDGKFSTALSAPAPNIEVMLLDMSNNPLTMDYSDNQGYFSFSNLGMGTYKVYAEVTGLPTNPAIVTLSANTPSVNNVTVLITPSGITTGINDNSPELLSLNKVYPVPVRDQLNIEFSLIRPSVTEITLVNLLGEKIVSRTESFNAGNHQVKIQLENLDAGTYFIHLNSQDGTMISRKITIVR
ncbi:MAG: PKD domain-containing protein [Bacteroidales bacterium]